jgi:Na+-transporting NADH:ubiquinone oxidoreductase subunit C
MKDSLRTIIFATVLGVVCAGLLAGANHLLKPYQQANAAAEKWRNVFGVLGVPFDKNATSTELLKLVRSKENPDGKVSESTAAGMHVYTYLHPQAGRLYAVEFSGPGLWGPIEGLLCLKSDLKTVYDISFYKQEETPGLGAEIAGLDFRGQFRDKTIVDPFGKPAIRVRKHGAVLGKNEVDGISGATLTCDKVDAMINAVSKRIEDSRAAILKEAGNE